LKFRKAFSISSELKYSRAFSFNSRIFAAASTFKASFVLEADSVRWNDEGEGSFET